VFEDLVKKESESFEHLRIKNYLSENVPLNNTVETIREECFLGVRRADIYFKLTSGKEIVIEIQHSKISVSDLMQRTKDYNDMGYHVLWILNGASHDRYPQRADAVRISRAEKFLHELYKKRVYYMNATKMGLQTSVYPLHFTNFREQKTLSSGFVYFRTSKTLRSVIPGEIPSLKFKIFRNLKYKLARFTDLSVRKQCVDALDNFLNNYNDDLSNLIRKGAKMELKKKLLFVIVAKFEPQFGLYLLYNVLKYLKVVKKEDFLYLLTIQQYLHKKHFS